MRHNFVNDIGDYAKYALLRALCASGHDMIRLGIIWYLTDHAERNSDGRRRAHLCQDGWDTLDPALLAMMRQLEKALGAQTELKVALIESSGILPPATAYFSEPVPRVHGAGQRRVSERAAWFDRAREAVQGCNLVFVDPDNGLEVPSVPVTSPLACKYVTIGEVAALLRGGAGVVIYQHGDRTPWPIQRERVSRQIVSAIDIPVTIRTLRFGAFGARAFFCVTSCTGLTRAVAAGLDRLRRRVEGWDKSRYVLID